VGEENDKPDTDTKPRAQAEGVVKPAFAVVGLGASAGGLDALCRFFERVPRDLQAAFVVVTHQAPENPGLFPQLLARCTPMPVISVQRAIELESQTVYVATPGSLLGIMDRVLHPTARDAAEKNVRHLSIDYFFRSLALAEGEHAVGVVLSGTGSDGTLGLKEIKAAGGMVMAQEESSARYSGMPHSAIATMLVDYVLPAEELPSRLARYLKR
jgi:two-component system CheB/CheR fusion protein